jgi:hypothetical protein
LLVSSTDMRRHSSWAVGRWSGSCAQQSRMSAVKAGSSPWEMYLKCFSRVVGALQSIELR